MKKIYVFLLTCLGLVIFVALLTGLKTSQFKLMGATVPVVPPTTVTSTEVKAEKWEPTLTAVGSLAPYQGVTVTTESSGIIETISFEAGSTVKAGDMLVKMDTSVLEAQLQAADARAELARVNAKRARELFASKSNSQAEVDTADALFKQAVAEVTAIKAQISQKQVRAPFSGRLGIRQINIGQYLDRGNPIVSLQSLDPIYVNFSLPQQQVAKITHDMKVRVVVDAMPGEVFEGKITAINPDIDASTRNVRIQGTLANAQERLRPGMFVNVAAVLPVTNDVLVIPATAVLYAPYGDSVFIIEPSKDNSAELTLRQQFVRLGKSEGDFVAISSGLKAGEKVVTTGVFKLRNNMKVIIDNKLAPEFSATPKPNNS